MSLRTRLRRLERLNAPPKAPGLILIPWGEWPEDEGGWEALYRSHPKATLFAPDQAPTADAWEAWGEAHPYEPEWPL